MKHTRNLIIASLLLQIYFICNLLSFGFWKFGTTVFVYIIAYFGLWIVGLTLLLWLYCKIKKEGILSRSTIIVLGILAFPMFGIWVQSLQIQMNWLEWIIVLIFPLIVVIYYRIGSSHIVGTVFAMLGLCVLSFIGHAELTTGIQSSSYQHPNMKFGTMDLQHKPNIHVIMFDALTNSAFSREFLGVTNLPDEFLSGLSDAISADSLGFQENIPTRSAWNTLFGLGIKISERYWPFSGSDQSPLTLLLRANGYKIQTGYSNSHLGFKKGPHVDFYHIGRAKLRHSAICDEKLLGFCSKLSQSVYNIFDEFINRDVDRIYAKGSWSTTVLELIENFEKNTNSPIFSAFYIFKPGHTPKNYETKNAEMFESYKIRFTENLELVRETLVNINELRLKFPDSIFIVAGDHGPYLTRNLKEGENERFRVLDRHNVALSLLNAQNLCEIPRKWLEKLNYITPSRMLAASLACSGDSLSLLDIFQDDRMEFIEFGNSYFEEK